MPSEREVLRATFDAAAEAYRARPGYPTALFDDLVALTEVAPGDPVLEVGCGTGTATAALSARGLDLTCVELGGALAAVAAHDLAGHRNVRVVHASFETWDPPPSTTFALVAAATAWHWLDPAIREERAWRLLRPGGHLAFWSATHVFPDGGDPFFVELQEVYDAIGEGLSPGAPRPRPGELPDHAADIDAGGRFRTVAVRHHDWETVHDAEGYLAVLGTFSGHIDMRPWQRDVLAREVRARLSRRPDGLLRRHWGAVLHVAVRVDPVDP